MDTRTTRSLFHHNCFRIFAIYSPQWRRRWIQNCLYGILPIFGYLLSTFLDILAPYFTRFLAFTRCLLDFSCRSDLHIPTERFQRVLAGNYETGG